MHSRPLQPSPLPTRRKMPNERRIGGLSVSAGLLRRSVRNPGGPAGALLQRVQPFTVPGPGRVRVDVARPRAHLQADLWRRTAALQRPSGGRRGRFHGPLFERRLRRVRVRSRDRRRSSSERPQGGAWRMASGYYWDLIKNNVRSAKTRQKFIVHAKNVALIMLIIQSVSLHDCRTVCNFGFFKQSTLYIMQYFALLSIRNTSSYKLERNRGWINRCLLSNLLVTLNK